jgi:hypothetical protein
MHHDAIQALDEVCANETRTRSMQILHYVLRGLMQDGYSMEDLDPRKAHAYNNSRRGL